jgi:hypothetical protein
MIVYTVSDMALNELKVPFSEPSVIELSVKPMEV